MTSWIIDTSVWSRIAHDPAVSARVEELVADPSVVLLACPPQVLEYCLMARSAAEYDEMLEEMTGLTPARLHPMADDVTAIQRALFARGQGRAAGPVGILTAAYARLNEAVVLAADHDYEAIAHTVGDFRCEYVAPSSR